MAYIISEYVYVATPATHRILLYKGASESKFTLYIFWESWWTKWRFTGLFSQYFGFLLMAQFRRCSELTVDKMVVYGFILALLRFPVDGAIS